jgi:carbamoyltransferase
MRVLGISCDYHDAAAALVIDGAVVAAAEEERFSRVKHDSAIPSGAIAACLVAGDVGPDDLDAVVFHEKPLGVASRVLAARQRRGPRALTTFAGEFPVLLRRNALIGYRTEKVLRALGGRRRPRLRYSEHHLSHAAAAFLPSPFDSAAILTIDGIGEWSTASVGRGVGTAIDLLEEQRYPNSLGLLYTLGTVWCGFAANDGEYKLMGLAPFGEPTYVDALRTVVDVGDDGSVDIDERLVQLWSRGAQRSSKLADLFDGPPLTQGEAVGRREADLARSFQEVVEDAVLRMAGHVHDLTRESRLCLGGGVALNCVANGKLRDQGPFDEIWVQPAPGDAGSAIGAALWYAHEVEGVPREAGVDRMRGAFLGPSFTGDEIHDWLEAAGVEHRRMTDRAERDRQIAARIDEGAVVGWFHGAMEFGPRALGHRSIIADPRSPDVQRDINLRVKGRESFRPFAPAVLADHAAEWFDLGGSISPYMLFTAPVTADRLVPVDHEPDAFAERVQVVRSEIPACTHVDGSARVQTVTADANPVFHGLLTAWHERTGCPVLLNTSFNVAGEPIVCTPTDALATARQAGLDVLVMEDCVLDPVPGGRR